MLSLMSPVASMRLLDDMMTDALMHDELLSDALRRSPPSCHVTSTASRVTEAANKITVSITAPGVAPADLTIEAIDGSCISVRGRTDDEARSYVVNYTVQLPADADATNASAEAADGLITVSMPKKATIEPAHITVHATSQAIPDAEEAVGETDKDRDKKMPYTLTIAAVGIAASELTLSVKPAGVGGCCVLRVAGSGTKTGARIDRHYQLPKDADADNIQASHVDGLLTLLIPQKAAPEPTIIAVNGVPASASVAIMADDEAIV